MRTRNDKTRASTRALERKLERKLARDLQLRAQNSEISDNLAFSDLRATRESP